MRVLQALHRDLHRVPVDVDPAGGPAGEERPEGAQQSEEGGGEVINGGGEELGDGRYASGEPVRYL